MGFASADLFRADQVEEILGALRQHRYLVEECHAFRVASIMDVANMNWRKRIDGLCETAESVPAYDPATIVNLRDRLRSLRGNWLAERFDRTILWRAANPMIQHRPGDVIMEMPGKSETILIEGWADEFESAALDMTNASPVDTKIAVAVSPLRAHNGKVVPWDERVTLRHAVHVESTGAGLNHGV